MESDPTSAGRAGDEAHVFARAHARQKSGMRGAAAVEHAEFPHFNVAVKYTALPSPLRCCEAHNPTPTSRP
eukprot:352239-Chlamydomonas_euryale.AAC.13